MASQIKPTNVRLGRNNSLDYSRLTRNTTNPADTTTQMNLLTLQTTDRDIQLQNLSRIDRLDGGDTTTGRGLSGGYTTGRSGVPSIIPQGINQQTAATEERKEDLSLVDDTIKELDFPNMFNLRDLTNSKIIHEIGSEMNTPQNDMIIPIKDRLKSSVLTQEEIANRLNSSIQSTTSPQKEKMRKVQSVQVIPKPMYLNMTSPVAFLGDEPATLGEGKMEVILSRQASASDIKSPEVSQTQETKCLVCFDKEPDAVFMECGHGGNHHFIFNTPGVCYDCSLEVWKTTNECYLCRDVYICYLILINRK